MQHSVLQKSIDVCLTRARNEHKTEPCYVPSRAKRTLNMVQHPLSPIFVFAPWVAEQIHARIATPTLERRENFRVTAFASNTTHLAYQATVSRISTVFHKLAQVSWTPVTFTTASCSALWVGSALATSTWQAYALSSSVLVRGSTSISSNWSMIAALLTLFPALMGDAGTASAGVLVASVKGSSSARTTALRHALHLCSCEWPSVGSTSDRDSRGAHGVLEHAGWKTCHVANLLDLAQCVVDTLPTGGSRLGWSRSPSRRLSGAGSSQGLSSSRQQRRKAPAPDRAQGSMEDKGADQGSTKEECQQQTFQEHLPEAFEAKTARPNKDHSIRRSTTQTLCALLFLTQILCST